MAKHYLLGTTLSGGVILHVKHAPAAALTGTELEALAASHALPARFPGEPDSALQARVHAVAHREEVEVLPGHATRVSAAFWERWAELNPGSSLLVDGKITTVAMDDADEAAADRADVVAANGAALDAIVAGRNAPARKPGENDDALRARLLSDLPPAPKSAAEIAADAKASGTAGV